METTKIYFNRARDMSFALALVFFSIYYVAVLNFSGDLV